MCLFHLMNTRSCDKYSIHMCVLVTQSCPALCNPMDCSSPGSSGCMEFSGQEYWSGLGCHFLLQGIFPTQRLNPGLLHCKQILFQLSHQGDTHGFFFLILVIILLGLPWWLRQLRICLQCRRPRFDPWVLKIPWRRE